MYIEKYWGKYIGGTDDSLNLVAFLEDQKKAEISLGEIFARCGLDKQNWDFRQTVEYLEFTHSNGVEMDFHFAIDVVTELAAILLECCISGGVNLQDLDEYNTPSRRIRITATAEEHDAMDRALADFAQNPLEYDLSEMMDEDGIKEMAHHVEALRKELYEAGGKNRNYHIKAEDVKELLPDWEWADGCIATSRIMVEGCKVGYCYREEPDGDWDSGWRFTAGDESEAYMDDPNNAGIYKLNTVCNDDPEIIPLLNTPAPCAYERDEDGVFQPVETPEPEDEEQENMDILQQCQIWNENDEYQKIIDALEGVPAEERTPEEDSELARAYNNQAAPGDRALFRKALALLKPHEEYFEGDYCWNFRMGYSYFYLDQEGRALPYFRKALEARPGDVDTKELIDQCEKRIALPQFSACFRERTEDWWETFADMEAELRQMMDEDKDHTRSAEIVAQMEEALNLVFDDIAFEMGYNGEKHELILTPEGDKVKLFALCYFRKHAPKPVLEHWNILVGRQPNPNTGLRTDDDWEISGEDVQVWLENQGENSFAISVYCEKLLPLLREKEGRAWWMLTTLTDQVLGEIPHMRYMDSFDVLEKPKAEPSILMSQLPDALKDRGLELSTVPEAYLESYLGYKMEPNQDPDADWRLDTIVGSTCCAPLINGYLNADNDYMDDLHADGAVAGFICYPLDTLREEEGSQKIFDFRDRLEETLTAGDGPEALTLTGGATGLFCGYVDFIAWDLRAALKMAKEFFEASGIPWASFHTFRREAASVSLWEQEGEPETYPETGSLLSAQDIKTLEAFDEGVSGYFGNMLQWLEDFIEQGVQKGKFTERQARQDLQIALWYSFACNNLDMYRYYYKAARWMPDSEKNAKGCAMWYYRYSVALMYCGRLEDALQYAEQGVREEPDYPWIWLQAGKLRSHFGDKAGALEAVERGLALEPGDYEFLTLKGEIEAGEPLERMEYHWINPDADRTLQQGLDADAGDKQRSISCITVDETGLERFWNVFGPKPEKYTPNAPFTRFPYTVNGRTFDLMFQMNEAGMSKLRTDWLEQLQKWIRNGQWLERAHPDGRMAELDTVLVDLNYHIGLLYKLSHEEEYFQIFLRPDGTEEDAFWSSKESGGPADHRPNTKGQEDQLEETLTGTDYIPYTPENAEAFYKQLEQWNDEDEYTRCVQALNAIPEDWRDYRSAYALARALENYAVIGDHEEGAPNYKGDKALLRAIQVLETVREEGQDKAEWNMRMAYAYQYLHGQEEKAIPYAQRWMELDPKDENAPAVLRECQEEIRKRRRRQNKKAKFVPGDVPFEGFDFTNFWDDNEYARKEYVSAPPSDELIASVEEELGYKLPASYIWLMKRHNGGIPVNTCYPTGEPTSWAGDHVAITGIFGIGREKDYSLCGGLGSQFMIDEWEYPAIGVAICDCPSAGHDMIFLDYRACGPQGEPAVVHVDQENDYKITHLADSFEEFIRGLENESVYDLDDDGSGEGGEEDNPDPKGAFAGFVLLSKGTWDKEQFIRDMKDKWGVTVEESDESEEKSEDALVFEVGDMLAAVSLMPYPIPGGEAEENAENNYMWPEAVEVAKAHKAHIMVAVIGKEEKILEKGRLFTKLLAACCRQEYATGVYTSGVVFEPRFYEGFADMMKEDELPIFNWVWFGLYRSEGGMNAYTYGMETFGKEEMEVLDTAAEPDELRDFLASMASYVLACDVTLKDGETIGFSEEDKHAVTRSPGVSLPEEQMTLKISWKPGEDGPDGGDHNPDGQAPEDEGEPTQPEVYTEEEMEAVEGHIQQYFGKFENVFHELVSPDIHVDICVVPPSEDRDYCTLVTMGMGAHRMNVPEELAEYRLERAELAIALPADWKLGQESMKDERWYWPIRLLKVMARLPIASDTWLGFGHTMDNERPFSENTKLCAALLTGPQGTEEGSEVCTLPGGEEVNFYQIIPLYRDELEYKLEHDADALLDKMAGVSFVAQPTRQDAITRGSLCSVEDADDSIGMDDASWHMESIEEKELGVDPINAYNHMAIYLRWCVEHDLMGEEFVAKHGEVVKQVKSDPGHTDLRTFIREELLGCLYSALFNQQGRAFAHYYYGEADSPYYPSDIDDYALKFFGPERYHSDEFQQEAYLFIPFDETYYQAMAKVIEERFVNWQGQDFDEDTLAPSDVAQAVMEYLDCACTYFPSMKDDDPIMSAYGYARRLGVREGFVPVLVKPDETLLECLVMNADPEHDSDCYAFDLKAVTEYRKKQLTSPIKDGKAVLEKLTGQRKEEAEDDDLDWEEEILGEMEGGYHNCRFASYWNSETDMTYPLILAKIPVKNPWELFAYLPFGNWNECPDTPELMAVAKYWAQQYGAAPAVMTHDELEFDLPAPVPQKRAMEAAVEQYGFCPDMDQNFEKLGALADTLRQSAVWYFWWD